MSDNIQFSEREKEVTELLLQGKSNKQIALALGISASTIEYHLKNIYKKLQVSTRTEAVLQLGKSIGGDITSTLGKSTVETNRETIDNGNHPISTRRFSMNKMFTLIGGGILAILLLAVLILIRIFNLSVQTKEIPITSISPLPDLAITSTYVSMVNNNGNCLPYYGLNVTVTNQGNAPALDVTLAETSTSQSLYIGNLSPLQSMSSSFVAKGTSGIYTVIIDPQNTIIESNEANNNATFTESTATPVADCLSMQFGEVTPTPFSPQEQYTATPQVLIRNLSLDILKNSIYRSPDWGEFQLSNGVYYRTPPNSQESPDAYTTHLLDTVLYGDINSDGTEDAVVFLDTQNGGTGHFVEMAVLLNLDGNAINVKTEYLGDRVVIESGTIQGGLITLTLRVQGPNDAACCPSQIIEKKFYIDAYN